MPSRRETACFSAVAPGIDAAGEELRPLVRERVEAVQRLAEALQLAADGHLGEVARDPERGGAAGAVLSGDDDDRVGARAPVARALVGAEQEDRRPRPLGRRGSRPASTSGERTSGRVSPGPSARRARARQPSGSTQLRQRRLGREEEPVRGQHVLRLLVREDGLEHGVAAHGHVRERDVRQRRSRRARTASADPRRRRPAPAPGVEHGEEPEAEEREVDREHAGDEPPVDRDDPGQPDGAGEHDDAAGPPWRRGAADPASGRRRAAGRARARASRGTPPGSA